MFHTFNPRVIVSGNSGDGFNYRIEDVYNGSNPNMFGDRVSLFVNHSQNLVCASSVKDLKRTLQAMLDACNKPVLAIDQPAPKLVEVKLK